MKAIFFGILSCVAFFLSIKIGRILYYDFDRLTQYGLGYLLGLVILFLLTGGIAIRLGFLIFGKKHPPSMK